jgi:hypothetical protein
MNDLFKKLNVLVKSSLNDRLSGDSRPERPRPGKNVQGEIDGLRERINDAVQYEDEIKARIRQFEDEAARWDSEADAAVARGDDANARYAIEQMRRAQQRATMTQADLREHQYMTQELIQRVNTLDAYVADLQRAEAASGGEAPAAPAEPPRRDAAPLPDLGNVLREAGEKIASLADAAAAQRELSARQPPEAETAPADAAEVDNDLDRRRQRLSKR